MKQKFEKGQIVKGKVTGITKYGIFVEFNNGYKGLIHISEISDSYVRDINIYANIGDVIPSKIIDLDEENKIVKLSLKHLDYVFIKENHQNKSFEILSKMLPVWMEKRIKEIKNN